MLTGFLAVDADAGSTEGHEARRLRQAAAAAAAAGLGRSRAGAGAQQLQRQPDRVPAAQPPPAGELHGGERQPAHPAGRRRPAVRATGLRARIRGATRTRCCRRCWSPSATRSDSPTPWMPRSTRSSPVTPGRRPASHPAAARAASAGNPTADRRPGPAPDRAGRMRPRRSRPVTTRSRRATSPSTARLRPACRQRSRARWRPRAQSPPPTWQHARAVRNAVTVREPSPSASP